MLVDKNVHAFLARRFKSPQWVIPSLVPAGGFTLLHGASKAGKSTLALQLAQALSTGEPFLDRWRPEHPWRVTYVQSDVSSVEWQGYMRALHVDGEIAIIHDLDYGCMSDPMQVKLMREHLQDLKTEFTFFDSTYKLPAQGSDLNTATGIQALLRSIAACWSGPFHLQHHSRKERESGPDDAVQGLAGHHTFAAAASAIWMLRRVGTQDRARFTWNVRLARDGHCLLGREATGYWAEVEEEQPVASGNRNGVYARPI